MNINDAGILINNYYKLLGKEDRFKNVLNMNKDKYNYNIVNRMLIASQDNASTYLKTVEQWELLNRKVTKGSKAISILMPVYSYSYINTENYTEANIDDMSLDEINKAIEYNIICKKESISNVYCADVFDVRDTTGTDNDYSHKYNTYELLEIFKQLTSVQMEIGEEAIYLKNSNRVIIPKQTYEDTVITLSEFIYQYCRNIKETNNSNKVGYAEFDDEIDLFKSSMQYSICTFFGIEHNFDLSNAEYIKKDKLLDMLYAIDSVIIDISNTVDKCNIIKNSMHNAEYASKASDLLRIIDANTINNKIYTYLK